MKRAFITSLLLISALAAGQTAPAPATPPATPAAGAPPQAATSASTTPAAPVNNLAKAVQARTPEEQAKQTGFQIVTVLDHWLGTGTFVDPKYYAYLAANLMIQPQFLFGVGSTRLVASAALRATYEYTLPDSDTGRRFAPADIRFGLAAPALFRDKKLTGLSITPSLGLTVPTTPESWNAGLISSLSLGAAATRSFNSPIGGIDLRLSAGGGRGFFTSATNAVRPLNPKARDAFGNLLVVCRAGEVACASAGQNTAWSANIGGMLQWRATGDFMIYTGYTFMKTWREASTLTADEFTPQALDSNGNPVARTGLGQVDRTSAFLGGSYQLNEHYSLDLGISTVQMPLTATGQVRFPLFSIGAMADNSTSAYFTLTAAY